jgi:hypothetical protein
LKARIFTDQAANLITQFLPLVNKISGARIGQDFGALLREDSNNGFGVVSDRGRLGCSQRAKCRSDAVEFCADAQSDLFCPLNLAGRAG